MATIPAPNPTPTQSPNGGFDADSALASGYSEDDVLDHLKQTRKFDVDGALGAGYSKRDVIDHLAKMTQSVSTIPGTDKTGIPPIAIQPNGAMDVLRSGTQFGPLANQTPPTIPQMRQAGSEAQEHQQFQQEHPIVSGATQILGSGLPMPAPMEMGSVENIPSALAMGRSIISKTKAAFKPDPTIGLVKVYRPTPSDSGFSERLPDTVAQIKAANPDPITGNEDVIAATQNAIKSHQDHLENAWMAPARARGVQVPGDSIAQAAIDAIPQSMWREDPATAQAIAARANQGYATQNLSVDQLRDLLKEKNADLKGFYDRSQGKQNASITSGDPQAVVKAQRDEIAARLYNALDPEGAGAGPRQIQSQTGDMIDLLEAAQRRRNAIMAEKPVSPAARLGKLAAATLDLPGKALHGDIEGGLSKLRSTRYGDSDPMIADIFRNAGTPQPLPSPNPPPVTAGLLGPGAIRTPPPADTSGPIPSAPRPGAGFSQSTGARTLPPAGSPIRNMPPVPDTSGPIKGREPRPGAGMGQTGAKELPKPSRFQQPGFATGTLDDAIPVVGDDGKVVYVPKWTLQNPPPSPPGTMPPPR